MSYYDYKKGQEIEAQGYPFYALIQAAMRQADSDNVVKLRNAFPRTYDELTKRYYAPNGVLPGEEGQNGN